MKVLRMVGIMILIAAAVGILAGASTPSKRVVNVQTLYNYLIYPDNQLAFPTSGTSPVDALFASSTQGRVAPFGEGHDLATVKKYFFGISPGLAPGSSNNSIPFTLGGVAFRSITDQNPLVFVEIDLVLTPTPLGQTLGYQNYEVRETGSFTFNKSNQITSFDLSIPYVDSAMATFAGRDFTNPTFVADDIVGMCTLIVNSCTGTNAQYTSLTDCESFLSSLPVGNWNRSMNQNSLSCRSFHAQYLLPIDPTNECTFVGRSGGTQCVNTNSYQNYIDELF